MTIPLALIMASSNETCESFLLILKNKLHCESHKFNIFHWIYLYNAKNNTFGAFLSCKDNNLCIKIYCCDYLTENIEGIVLEVVVDSNQ